MSASSETHVLSFLARLRASVDRLRLQLKRENTLRFVVAVSGGEDSHALLHALHAIGENSRLELMVAHFDHALRPESGEDARFVEALAEKYQLPFYFQRAETGPERENLEAWARTARYRFLEEVRASTASDLVLTAHHRSDQVETVLHRVLSGRFLTDATGIAELNLERHLFRPLLETEKVELETYASHFDLAYVLDSSNMDLSRTRNQIRHELLPQLKSSFDPQVETHLEMLAMRSAEDEALIAQMTERRRQELPRDLSRQHLLSLEPALRWRMLSLLAVEQLGMSAKKLGYRAFRWLAQEIERGASELRKYDLGFRIQCEISEDSGVRYSFSEETQPVSKLEPALLAVPGKVLREYSNGAKVQIHARVLQVADLEGVSRGGLVEWTKSQAVHGSAEESAVAYFDFDHLAGKMLRVRERENGDAMQVWQRGSRKLKKLFLEHEISLAKRESVPLIELEDEIIWVPGVARNDLAAVCAETERLLELSYQRF